jgi:mannose-6-phosphate isomerase
VPHAALQPLLPPLRFTPIPKARPWGASRLAALGKGGVGGATIGESWEVADLPDAISDGQSTVDGGPLAGMTLRALREANRRALLGIATPAPDGAFPLLVKYLDAADNLSLQVHPDAAYAAKHPDAHLKTEAWIIVACEPGARVYRGIRLGTTHDEFAAALAAGRALEHIESYPVAPGDCIYLPSGVCHALGAGILAAEVQTPSDTTFRVWDWDRHDPKRPLHLEQAWQCLKFGRAQDDGTPGFTPCASALSHEAAGIVTRRLCRSRFFSIELLDATRDARIPVAETGIPEVWMTLGGACRWTTSSGALDAPAGATVLRPAHVEPGEVTIAAGSRVLRTTCASHLDRAM